MCVSLKVNGGCIYIHVYIYIMGRSGRDRMVVGLTTTCGTICDKVCQ